MIISGQECSILFASSVGYIVSQSGLLPTYAFSILLHQRRYIFREKHGEPASRGPIELYSLTNFQNGYYDLAIECVCLSHVPRKSNIKFLPTHL